MNSLQIQYFLTVAQYLNFSKAAEHHYTSQPSVSRQIALLEKELGFELFFRTKHSVQLTPAGKIVYDEFSQLYQKAAAVLEKARQTSRGMDGNLNIGYLQEQTSVLFCLL
jgi:DNA-binding transcriptional LysR family regulator